MRRSVSPPRLPTRQVASEGGPHPSAELATIAATPEPKLVLAGHACGDMVVTAGAEEPQVIRAFMRLPESRS